MRRDNDAETSKQEMTETIVSIRRVAKTVKGGRNMRFSVTIVVGDHNGKVGVGDELHNTMECMVGSEYG